MSPNVSQMSDAPKTPRENTLAENRPSMITPEKSFSNNSFDSSRAPMLSPSRGHKDYNRFKYYSALRTGYGHLGIE